MGGLLTAMFRRRSPAFALAAGVSVLLSHAIAVAQGIADQRTEQVRARAAYDRGAIAYRQGDFARAATEYAQADQLVPMIQVLEAALDSALLADDPLIGGQLHD